MQCFNCGSYDHLARNCPNPQRQTSRPRTGNVRIVEEANDPDSQDGENWDDRHDEVPMDEQLHHIDEEHHEDTLQFDADPTYEDQDVVGSQYTSDIDDDRPYDDWYDDERESEYFGPMFIDDTDHHSGDDNHGSTRRHPHDDRAHGTPGSGPEDPLPEEDIPPYNLMVIEEGPSREWPVVEEDERRESADADPLLPYSSSNEEDNEDVVDLAGGQRTWINSDNINNVREFQGPERTIQAARRRLRRFEGRHEDSTRRERNLNEQIRLLRMRIRELERQLDVVFDSEIPANLPAGPGSTRPARRRQALVRLPSHADEPVRPQERPASPMSDAEPDGGWDA